MTNIGTFDSILELIAITVILSFFVDPVIGLYIIILAPSIFGLLNYVSCVFQTINWI